MTGTKSLSLSLALLMAVAGCGKNASQGSGHSSPTSISIPTKSIEAGLKAVPDNAAVVVTIASPQSFWDLIVKQGFLPTPVGDSSELHTAMMAHAEKHLGLDLSKVQSIVGYALKDGGAIIVAPVGGSLKGASESKGIARLVLKAGTSNEVVVIKRKDMVLIGEAASVNTSLALLEGSGNSLSGEFADFAAGQRKGAYFSLAAELDRLPLPPNPFSAGLRRGGFQIGSDGIRLQVEGESSALDGLKAQFAGAVQMGLAQIKAEMENTQDDFLTGAGAIWGYYNFKTLAKTFEPKVEGDTMTVQFDLLGGGTNGAIVVSVIGVLAAVAVPAFMKYMKKSKAAEANVFLKRMSNSARSYYALGDIGDSGVPTKSFPPKVGPTPPLGSCCAGGEECVPKPGQWDHPSWKALDFAMTDPHHYSYEFRTESKDGAAFSYTALAYGDLDCDGDYSTFSLYGQVVNGEVQTAGDILKADPLE